jgi:hypothetical protein
MTRNKGGVNAAGKTSMVMVADDTAGVVEERGVALRPRQAVAAHGDMRPPFGRMTVDLNELPGVVTEQWHRAQDGLLEILRFGVMMMEMRIIFQLEINSPKRGRGAKGLKAWLSEHCPDVNYNTATGYMVAAEGLKNIAEIKDDVPLLSLMGSPDPKEEVVVADARERVAKALDGASLRLLKEAGPHISYTDLIPGCEAGTAAGSATTFQ